MDILYFTIISVIISLMGFIGIKTLLLNDTRVDSPFFTIDRAKSIRFSQLYMTGTVVVSALTIMLFPFIFGIITGLVIFILILILDLLLLIPSLFSFIFTGSIWILINPIGITLNVGITVTETLSIIYDVFNLYAVFSIIASSLIGGYALGRYVEDRKSGIYNILLFGVTIFSILIIFSMHGVFVNANPLSINETYLSPLYSLIPLFGSYLISFSIHHEQHSFELRYVHTYHQYFYLLLAIVGTGFGAVGLGTVLISDYITLNLQNWNLNYLYMIISDLSVLSYLAISVIVLLYSGITGDFSLDQKAEELEYRDDLIEMGEEFKNLNEDNIDEFVQNY